MRTLIHPNAESIIFLLHHLDVDRWRVQLTCGDLLVVNSVPAPARSPHLPLAHRRRGRGALEQLVPVLLADEAPGQHVVPVPGDQRGPALAAHEAFQVEDVEGRPGLMGRGPPGLHAHLAGRDRQAASRARSRVAEYPAGTITTLARLNFYFRFAYAFGGVKRRRAGDLQKFVGDQPGGREGDGRGRAG